MNMKQKRYINCTSLAHGGNTQSTVKVTHKFKYSTGVNTQDKNTEMIQEVNTQADKEKTNKKPHTSWHTHGLSEEDTWHHAQVYAHMQCPDGSTQRQILKVTTESIYREHII